ncbi:MAG: hypothetical protein CMH07_01335 [Marinovum sp.]|nr:hypothetical protein [Marinovum sp.]
MPGLACSAALKSAKLPLYKSFGTLQQTLMGCWKRGPYSLSNKEMEGFRQGLKVVRFQVAMHHA